MQFFSSEEALCSVAISQIQPPQMLPGKHGHLCLHILNFLLFWLTLLKPLLLLVQQKCPDTSSCIAFTPDTCSREEHRFLGDTKCNLKSVLGISDKHSNNGPFLAPDLEFNIIKARNNSFFVKTSS